MNTPEGFGRTLNTEEAAAILKRPVQTLRWWRHINKGPRSFTIGGRRVYYREADVLEWLTAQYDATVTDGDVGRA